MSSKSNLIKQSQMSQLFSQFILQGIVKVLRSRFNRYNQINLLNETMVIKEENFLSENLMKKIYYFHNTVNLMTKLIPQLNIKIVDRPLIQVDNDLIQAIKNSEYTSKDNNFIYTRHFKNKFRNNYKQMQIIKQKQILIKQLQDQVNLQQILIDTLQTYIPQIEEQKSKDFSLRQHMINIDQKSCSFSESLFYYESNNVQTLKQLEIENEQFDQEEILQQTSQYQVLRSARNMLDLDVFNDQLFKNELDKSFQVPYPETVNNQTRNYNQLSNLRVVQESEVLASNDEYPQLSNGTNELLITQYKMSKKTKQVSQNQQANQLNIITKHNFKQLNQKKLKQFKQTILSQRHIVLKSQNNKQPQTARNKQWKNSGVLQSTQSPFSAFRTLNSPHKHLPKVKANNLVNKNRAKLSQINVVTFMSPRVTHDIQMANSQSSNDTYSLCSPCSAAETIQSKLKQVKRKRNLTQKPNKFQTKVVQSISTLSPREKVMRMHKKVRYKQSKTKMSEMGLKSDQSLKKPVKKACD